MHLNYNFKVFAKDPFDESGAVIKAIASHQQIMTVFPVQILILSLSDGGDSLIKVGMDVQVLALANLRVNFCLGIRFWEVNFAQGLGFW